MLECLKYVLLTVCFYILDYTYFPRIIARIERSLNRTAFVYCTVNYQCIIDIDSKLTGTLKLSSMPCVCVYKYFRKLIKNAIKILWETLKSICSFFFLVCIFADLFKDRLCVCNCVCLYKNTLESLWISEIKRYIWHEMIWKYIYESD